MPSLTPYRQARGSSPITAPPLGSYLWALGGKDLTETPYRLPGLPTHCHCYCTALPLGYPLIGCPRGGGVRTSLHPDPVPPPDPNQRLG